MPSTVVHLAVAGMIAGTLLGDAFDWRSLSVVFAVVFVPDLDSFASLVSSVGHRAALHNVFVPLIAGLALYADLSRGERSYVRRRWGARGIRIAWVSLFCYVTVGIGLDLVAGAANPLWPVHDQYYHVDGRIELSSQRGLVQTVVDWQPTLSGGETGSGASGGTDGGTGGGSGAESRSIGSTNELHLGTGIDPTEGPEPEDVDRVFPIVRSGWQLVVLLVGSVVTAARFRVDQSVGDEE